MRIDLPAIDAATGWHNAATIAADPYNKDTPWWKKLRLDFTPASLKLTAVSVQAVISVEVDMFDSSGTTDPITITDHGHRALGMLTYAAKGLDMDSPDVITLTLEDRPLDPGVSVLPGMSPGSQLVISTESERIALAATAVPGPAATPQALSPHLGGFTIAPSAMALLGKLKGVGILEATVVEDSVFFRSGPSAVSSVFGWITQPAELAKVAA